MVNGHYTRGNVCTSENDGVYFIEKMQDNIEKKALDFATQAHGDQKRKYKDEAYIEHPKRVAERVRTIHHTPAMICAAYLHDVVEDTPVTLAEIEKHFGKEIADLVEELTDEFTKENYPHLNRRKRKKKETERIGQISPRAQTIKLADIIDNLPSVSKRDPGFAKRYVPEMEAVIEVLEQGDSKLRELAKEEVQIAKNRLSSKP